MSTVLLSPHPDDIAYSCGGAVAQRRWGEPATVVTVFSRSAYATCRRWQPQGPAAITRRREHEDRTYCERHRLGHRVLGFPDSSLRGYDEVTERQASREDEVRKAVAAAIAAIVESLQPARVVAPAALGDHVDHVLVRDAGLAQLRPGVELWLYEDVPYVAELPLDEIERRMLHHAEARFVDVAIGAALEAKIHDMWLYATQTDETSIRDMLRHAVRRRGAERFWVRGGTP